jgi:hypothetical protein
MKYEKLDAETFAEWKVDYLKLDGCNSSPEQKAEGWAFLPSFIIFYCYVKFQGYPLFTKTLNESGRPIAYSCSWPAYLEQKDVNF